MSTPVLESPFFRQYFDPVEGGLPIWVLGDAEAQAIWQAYFGVRSSSFFDLSEDSWVVRAKKVCLGQWLPGLNARKLEPFRQLLAAGISWSMDQKVVFAVNRTTMLECTWATFLTYWNNFLYVESDAVMLLTTSHSHQCILFRAIGDALFVAD